MFLSDLNPFDLKCKFCQVKFQGHMCDIVYSHDASTRTASVIPEISYFDICRTNVNNGLQISMTHSVVEYGRRRQVKRELNVSGWISRGNIIRLVARVIPRGSIVLRDKNEALTNNKICPIEEKEYISRGGSIAGLRLVCDVRSADLRTSTKLARGQALIHRANYLR